MLCFIEITNNLYSHALSTCNKSEGRSMIRRFKTEGMTRFFKEFRTLQSGLKCDLYVNRIFLYFLWEWFQYLDNTVSKLNEWICARSLNGITTNRGTAKYWQSTRYSAVIMGKFIKIRASAGGYIQRELSGTLVSMVHVAVSVSEKSLCLTKNCLQWHRQESNCGFFSINPASSGGASELGADNKEARR